jgi:hypothetical protein
MTFAHRRVNRRSTFERRLTLGCDNCSGNDAQNIIEAMKSFALLWGMQGEAGESCAARRAFKPQRSAAPRRSDSRTRLAQ